MIERDYGVRFLLKPLQSLSVTSKAQWQKFERGFATRRDISGQIDFAHPTGTDRFRNFVVADRPAHERISLLIFNNSRRNADSRGFDKAACSLTRGDERFYFAAEKLIAFA